MEVGVSRAEQVTVLAEGVAQVEAHQPWERGHSLEAVKGSLSFALEFLGGGQAPAGSKTILYLPLPLFLHFKPPWGPLQRSGWAKA